MIEQMLLQAFLFALLSAFLVSAEVSRNLAPLVFLPGFTGSRLYAQIEDAASLPVSCRDSNIPIGVPFVVLFNASLMFKQANCLYDLLSMNFDSLTKTFGPQPGINISTVNFGGFDGIEAIYYSFPLDVKSWGYEVNVNLFGAPYDYRYMSADSLTQIGFIADLKALVERAFHLNNGRKVVLVGHSNGGPTMYSFLTSNKLISPAWKDKYIAAMVGLSGNFLGQMNGYRVFTYSSYGEAEQSMYASWEASYGTGTWGEYSVVSTIPVITTFANTPYEQNYTSTFADMTSLFIRNGHADWAEKLSVVHDCTMNRTAHPGVNIHCLYGSNVSTENGYIFAHGINEGKYTEVRTTEGDGNQDHFDNEFCKVWAAANLPYLFEAVAFPNVHHMQMVSDENVLNKLHEIVLLYSESS